MSIDTKALPSSEPKATVALVRRYLAESYEASRAGMTCGTPKAVRVDCAMVERLCRVAEKQAARLAALEADNQRLRSVLERAKQAIDILADMHADDKTCQFNGGDGCLACLAQEALAAGGA